MEPEKVTCVDLDMGKAFDYIQQSSGQKYEIPLVIFSSILLVLFTCYHGLNVFLTISVFQPII